MNAIIAVQDLIRQNQKRIKILQQQLDDHNSGKSKLSIMGVASTENGIEKSQEALEKNQMILNELMKHDIQEIMTKNLKL